MRAKYLGDSYDIVKRFWAERLRQIAPLYAHSKFVPAKIRSQYTALTSIQILDSRHDVPFGILLDPHTGIPSPSESQVVASVSHAPLQFMAKINDELQPKYMICFDQSYHRQHELNKEEQRKLKREFLRKLGIFSFYYVSHAPFLFMAQNPEILVAVRSCLSASGLPAIRFEPLGA